MSLADLPPGQNAEQVRNHWWWRPGWHVGRRFFAFHITFESQPALHDVAGAYRTALAEMPSLTLIPDQWLHLTMQGIGFTDEIQPAALSQLAEEARNLLAAVPAFEVEFGSVIVADEAIVMPANPPEPVQELRQLTRTALGRVFGEEQVPESADKFRPHVSVAYLTADGSSAPYIEAVNRAKVEQARVTITHVDLIEMHRDQQMYEWRTVEALPLA
ncbi:2'-5' RNA ligase family protein [Micromonospora sp. BRA006-A]|uniref:2'-5' RNA ligase family protein n=1 Tax=Micromonospora sp. BRA006-A TaxID=2962860 RepID=UPI00296EA7D5|nr:2'-5' RNA ligase family protein [Micromonospora sp. BRA006-A]MDW3845695.1 2'-5' RNA ligase family protein [Micromonospora sp. BRA006-A]